MYIVYYYILGLISVDIVGSHMFVFLGGRDTISLWRGRSSQLQGEIVAILDQNGRDVASLADELVGFVTAGDTKARVVPNWHFWKFWYF